MSDKAWERFARADPYWAVLTDPRYKTAGAGTLSPERRDAFFNSGQTHVRGVADKLAAHFGRRFTKSDCCVDFGSGVGRLLIPMARMCGRAIGLDISPTMRRLCMENALAFGAGNIECYPQLDHPALGTTGFDWVNSYIVFQHLDTRLGYQILEELLSRVNPNGAISLHFTVYKDRRAEAYLAGRYRYFTVDQDGVRDVFPEGGFYSEDAMMMNDYDVTKLYMILGRHGFVRVLTEHEDQGGMHGLNFFALKQA